MPIKLISNNDKITRFRDEIQSMHKAVTKINLRCDLTQARHVLEVNSFVTFKNNFFHKTHQNQNITRVS